MIDQETATGEAVSVIAVNVNSFERTSEEDQVRERGEKAPSEVAKDGVMVSEVPFSTGMRERVTLKVVEVPTIISDSKPKTVMVSRALTSISIGEGMS